ncbi:MAG: hypothetical protein O2950_01890 [Proteobacteria bacterium]|nr:hypothetical protein [Pseudomonadota bacterium]MDA1351021.1 hypothetical protein [Pseudomonadota bacterium]
MSRGLGSSSVQRNFSCIKAVVNFVILEKGLDCNNPFSGVYLHSDNSSKKRKPIPLDSLKILQQGCVVMDDDLRHQHAWPRSLTGYLHRYLIGHKHGRIGF